jgi:hypothetical protein
VLIRGKRRNNLPSADDSTSGNIISELEKMSRRTMKRCSLLKLLFVAATVALLFAGIGFRVYWKSGGPDTAYWLGEITMSCFGVFAGIMTMLRTINKKQIHTFLFGAVVALLGVLLFLNTIRLINTGCPPLGC